MSFGPLVPFAGLAGLRFLDETLERQTALFERTPEIKRSLAAFDARAAEITTVDALMADREVLGVVLGAFGLEEEIDKRAFIRKVVEEGTLAPEAFANRLADPAYRELADALGFGNLGGRLIIDTVRADIRARFQERAFERAVGDRDVDLRLALNFRREMGRIAASETAETSGWLRVLGSQPLRRVIETAYALPQQFGLAELDRQVADLETRTRARFGETSPRVFSDPAVIEEVVSRFLLRAQALSGAGASAAGAAPTAVQILQAGGLGAGAQAGLFASSFV
ncbi:MAG: DUF1217 domain-containing protein [Pikeienuella sp.]